MVIHHLGLPEIPPTRSADIASLSSLLAMAAIHIPSSIAVAAAPLLACHNRRCPCRLTWPQIFS